MKVLWTEQVAARFERDYADDPEPFEAAARAEAPGYRQPPGSWIDEAEGLLGAESGDEEAWGKVHGLAFYLQSADEEGVSR